MLLKANEFRFPDAVRARYFPLVRRASPLEGWPRGIVVVSEKKLPYRNFLQVIGTSPTAEFEAQVGDHETSEPRISVTMLEEIALNCPLSEDEAGEIREEHEALSLKAGDRRPSLFINGLIAPIFLSFQSGMLSFSSALVLSLYVSGEAQREVVGLGFVEKSPETILKMFADPFLPGDILNRLEREPGRLQALGYGSLRAFLLEQAPISYGRGRFLMRLAAAIPAQKRRGLTSDQGELLLRIGRPRREALFRGQRITLDGKELDLREISSLSRVEVRKLIRKAGEESGGTQA